MCLLFLQSWPCTISPQRPRSLAGSSCSNYINKHPDWLWSRKASQGPPSRGPQVASHWGVFLCVAADVEHLFKQNHDLTPLLVSPLPGAWTKINLLWDTPCLRSLCWIRVLSEMRLLNSAFWRTRTKGWSWSKQQPESGLDLKKVQDYQ